jgi:hypothetical protein
MSAICRYKILPEFKLVIGKYTGKISEKEIISLKEEITNDKDFDWNYNVLDDYSDTVFNLSEKGPEIMKKWLQENYSSSRQSSLLTSSPGQVVIITLFKHLDKNTLPMSIKIFSTLSSALPWVGISSTYEQEIAEIMKEL